MGGVSGTGRFDAGRRITWDAPGGVTRSGVIWSEGPVPASLWVIPDSAPGTCAAVKLPSPKHPSPRELPKYGPAWQRDARRRIAAVLTHGALYATVEGTERVWWSDDPVAVLLCHADPGCPAAAGRERRPPKAGPAELDLPKVVAILSQPGGSTGALCPVCIWLDLPERADGVA